MHMYVHTHVYVLLIKIVQSIQEQSSFLAPVDFDLSFHRKGFFSPYNLSHDHQLFDSWMASEHTEFERALSGETVNTGMSMVPSMVCVFRCTMQTTMSMCQFSIIFSPHRRSSLWFTRHFPGPSETPCCVLTGKLILGVVKDRLIHTHFLYSSNQLLTH